MQKFILAALCVVMIGAAFAFAQQKGPAKVAGTKWEYLVSGQDGTKEQLDNYGESGWELVAVIAAPDRNGNFSNQRFYYKRPKQ